MIWIFIGGELGKQKLMDEYNLTEKEARQCARSRFYGWMFLITAILAIITSSPKDINSTFTSAIFWAIIVIILFWNAERIKKRGLSRPKGINKFIFHCEICNSIIQYKQRKCPQCGGVVDWSPVEKWEVEKRGNE